MDTKFGSSAAGIQRLLNTNLNTWETTRQRRRTGEPRQVCAFVAISRQVAAGGSELAAGLGERLGWPVFDKEVLQVMGGDDKIRERLYAWMDERDAGWLEQMLEWLIQGRFPPQDYFSKLTKSILTLARGASAVFLGRGADLILPKDHGLRVRLVAPLEERIRTYGQRHGLAPEKAAKEVERIDRERAEFIRHHFRRDWNEPTRCDITLNSEDLSVEDMVEIIATTMNRRGIK